MRFLFACILVVLVAGSQSWVGLSEESKPGENVNLEKLLTTYLQGRLAEAEQALKGLQEGTLATLPQLLAAEDEIDKWRLHLRLATQGKLIADHPIFGALQREFGVPELPESVKLSRRVVLSTAIQEYLQGRLQRAERARDIASVLYKAGRATESELVAAKARVEGLKLLTEAERHKSANPRE